MLEQTCHLCSSCLLVVSYQRMRDSGDLLQNEGESLQQQSELEKEQLRAEAEAAQQKLAQAEQQAAQASSKAAQELETLQHSHTFSQVRALFLSDSTVFLLLSNRCFLWYSPAVS